MNLEIGFLFGVLGVMVFFFLTEKLPVELTAFAGLAVLTLTHYVTAEEAFEGFASPAVITMLSVFFIGAALLHTGVTDAVGSCIHALVGGREAPLIIAVMLVAGLLSSFMNNVAATAVLLPAVASLARRTKVAPSLLFMPLAFGTILGGTTTLVGTPPNILAAEMLSQRGLTPFGLFDYTPFGLALLGLGILYMVTVGRRLLPRRETTDGAGSQADLTSIYRLRERLFSIRVPPGSPLDGLSLRQAQLGTALDVNVVAIVRAGRTQPAPQPDHQIRGGDLLLVEGRFSNLEQLLKIQGVEVGKSKDVYLREAAGRFSGLVVRSAETSALAGQTLRELRFRERFGVVVAAVWRHGERLPERPAEVVLEGDDELLVLGGRGEIEEMAAHPGLEVLEVGPAAVRRLRESLFQVRINRDSPLAGVTLSESGMSELVGLTVIGAIEDGGGLRAVSPEEVLEEDDQLLVTGEPTRILRLLQMGEMEVTPEAPAAELESSGVRMIEAVVAPRSRVAGRSLRDLDFRGRYGLQVLAIWREGEPIHSGLADMPLRFGDALLLQGPTAKIRRLGLDADFLALSAALQEERRAGRAPFALAGLVLMVALVAAGLFPIEVTAFAGAVLVLISGALTMEEAYRAIEWRAIFLVAAILPVGIAVERSGAALLVADGVVGVAGSLGPQAVLVALLILSSLLSQGLDGAPAVVLLAPVAFQVAERLQISPYPLMMGIGLAASAAFMTPFSQKAGLLVMSAGGYRVGDFIKVGTILTLIFLALLAVMIPMLMPFS
ncbi:MAG: SLC13 family permease [Acidobacteriota bacterium]